VVGWNVIDNSSLQNDESLHGTIIAQLIAGLADSPMGPGVAPEVQIIPVDFMDENGGNELDAIAAIEYTIRHGAKIINNSWSTPCSKSLREKYPEWEAKGVLLVHAAGNKGIDLAELPESSSNYKGRGFLTVGSTDDADRRASFSNFGKSVDIFTQGTNITTIDQGYFEEGIETQLIEVSGTSYSTAIVSGLAALVWSKHPEWSNYQVKSALIGLTSQDESSPGIPYIDPNKLETFAN
jgi:subtilisin family serine protease